MSSHGQPHHQQYDQAPIPLYGQGLEVVTPADPEWISDDPASQAGKLETSHLASDATTERPWWKKKRIWLSLAAVVVIAIALGVGLGIGLNGGNDGSEGEDNSGSDGSGGGDGGDGDTNANDDTQPAEEPPDCGGSICPSILSMTVYESELYIFARTSDNTIAYRLHNGSSWADDWEDLGETTGTLISQPWTFAWNVNNTYPRLDLFSISTSQRTLYTRWFSEAEGWAPWIHLKYQSGSAIALCLPFTDRLDIWGTDRETRNITHLTWVQYSDEKIDDEGWEGDTEENGSYGIRSDWMWLDPSGSAPAVACRDSDTYHDVLWYDKERTALHHAYRNDDWHTYPTPWRGDWIGDPTIFTSPDDPERWEFFGIQENHEMYHLSWNSDDGYSPLSNLGGSIISTPAVISLEEGVYDILALGTNGTLQHRHFDGSGWSADWEDLGLRAHSAPTITNLNGHVFVAAVAQDGSLIVWSRSNAVEEKWDESLEPENLGGKVSLGFYTEA